MQKFRHIYVHGWSSSLVSLAFIFAIYISENLQEVGISKDKVNSTLESVSLGICFWIPDTTKWGALIYTSTETFENKTQKFLNIFRYILILSCVLKIKLVLTFEPGYTLVSWIYSMLREYQPWKLMITYVFPVFPYKIYFFKMPLIIYYYY